MGDVASEVQECLELINEDLAQLEECALDSGLAKVERQSVSAVTCSTMDQNRRSATDDLEHARVRGK